MRHMILKPFHICLTLALCLIQVAFANTHGKCYCKLQNASAKCLTSKACEIYKTSKEIFDPDPARTNVTMLWQVCATLKPAENGRVWYVDGLGGNEFEQSCYEAQSSGACPGSDGSIESVCR
ncbi:hypothetical protein CGRA01v4_09673 [Colletotrichum graminicola]|nr:hypothetical protein CGRA01v4_09673 [Colletotrichum graminicola]